MACPVCAVDPGLGVAVRAAITKAINTHRNTN
jgi:hypothetical protein